MNSFLVTTDFSENSTSAIRFALKAAEQTNAALIFYHVIEVMKPTSWSEEKYKKFEQAKNEEFTEKLRDFVSSSGKGLVKDAGNFTYLTEIGTEVAELTIKAAKKNKVSFICTSTKGAGNVKRFFGTNSSTLITHSPIPLAIIPHNYEPATITKLFYASDLEGFNSEMAIVKQLAEEFNAALTVYHYDYALQQGVSTAHLEKKAAPFAAANVTFNFKLQEIDLSLSGHLNRDIKKEDPSAIILFTKQNRNWFDRFFSPSETASLSFNSSVPLIVFRKNR
jgi:nucleotide-binding universal stress UspA family protein